MASLMSSNQKPTVAFVLSLLSGIFIILVSAVWCLWLVTGWGVGWMEGMMHGWEENMHPWNIEGMTYIIGIVGIIFGIIIIVSAVMLYINSTQHVLWGALIIVFSVISIISCMGGLGVGLTLGIIGGILAILWKPKETS